MLVTGRNLSYNGRRSRRTACTYERGRKCLLQGLVGVKKWRPAWVCDFGTRGLRRQTQLSFGKKTSGEDTMQVEGGSVPAV